MAPLIKEYFKLTSEYKKEYGNNTLVLMQVGAFYEVYGLQDKEGIVTGSNIKEFSAECDLATPSKHVKIEKKDVIMAGFRDYQLEKYLNKLQEMGYTTVVYTQDVQAPNTTRSISGIYSPGTYFSDDTKTLSNNTLCVWIQTTKGELLLRENIHIGLANVDIYTGKTTIFEFSNEYQHNPTTFDELERFVSICNPSEVIIISPFKDEIIEEIINFAGINCSCIHKFSPNDETKMGESIKNCEKQIAQIEIIKRFFTQENESTFFDNFYQYNLATQAFCFLLDYIYKHNPNLVNKLKIPIFENCSNRLILANHSLKQLNIIDDQNYRGKLSSIQKFLNNSVTIMGKRRFAYDLLNPMRDVEKLNESYDITEHILNKDKWNTYRTHLGNICDIEKLRRKLILTKITPKDFYMLYVNLEIIKNLYETAMKDSKLAKYINTYISSTLIQDCNDLMKFMDDNLLIKRCREIDTLSFDKALQTFSTFVKKGASKTVDEKVQCCVDSKDQLICIKESFNSLLASFEKKVSKDFIKIHETATLGTSLITTQRRSIILKREIENIIKGNGNNYILSYKSKYTKSEELIELDLSQIDYRATSSSANSKNMAVSSSQIKAICNNVRTSKDKLVRELEIFFQEFVSKFVKFENKLDNIIEFVVKMDTLQCKCYNASKFNFCKPKIEEKEKSFIKAKELKHCLIEQLQTQELYVTNDVELGTTMDGMLLYGTNAVGKTSFIKSLGIAVIMAQSGMYVPCSEFVFSPYKYIFTRILGNDNIFKGLSTFAVEMSELRTILKLADKNSLILGDELCSGTESDSARSIFVAGLEELHKIESSFIFATHFHEITHYNEIKALTKMCMKHMTVIYNKEKNTLIYDRKLKEGPGDSMYGLEVCKALDLPEDFLHRAHDIRMKYNPKQQSILSMKTSHFNSGKLRGICEICEKEIGSEVHHLQFQKNANKTNYINSFHKNHEANLINICETCHQKIHKENQEYKKSKTNKGYELTPIVNNA